MHTSITPPIEYQYNSTKVLMPAIIDRPQTPISLLKMALKVQQRRKITILFSLLDDQSNHLPRLPLLLSKYEKLAFLGLVGVGGADPVTAGIPILTSPILLRSPCSAILTSIPGSRFSNSTPSG